MTWICLQNGAREHYAIPRALSRSDRLEMLFTELWAGNFRRQLAVGPLRSLTTRFHPDLAGALVVDWTGRTLWRELKAKINKTRDVHAQFIQQGRWFSEKVREHLSRHETEVRGKIVFSYDTTALELFRWAKERGAFCVLGQMDPGRVEVEQVSAESDRWRGWERAQESGNRKSETGNHSLEAYLQRREEEWRLADRIVVNSRWSFEALVKQGVSAEKLVVIPLCYEAGGRAQRTEEGSLTSAPRFSTSRHLRVLFLGQVILRKGIQYLIEAAKLLRDEWVQFDVVGAIGISEAAQQSAPDTIRFHGPVSRDRAAEWYRKSDVFVLPTISDGFAITQIEAMAHGLPVIATPNCGEVVSDAVDGFIVPARDAAALAQVVRRYLREPELLPIQSAAALEKATRFSLVEMEERLKLLESELTQS